MNKQELIEILRGENGLTKSVAKAVVNLSFNPKTGKKVKMKPKKLPFFKCGKH
jgi:nucleoid DNA-binding protein